MTNLKVFVKSLIIIIFIVRNSSSQNNDQKVSLAFVFDTTYSMSDELREMKRGAVDILHRMIKEKGDSLQNFIFVPFNDPEVGPVTADTNPDRIQQALEGITLGGNYNYDCPEKSISGIKMAIQSSLPHSYIFVITDASSKDYYLLDDVLKLIQEKQSQIVFILTGYCGSVSEAGYEAYQRIKEVSGGQIFSIKKNEISQVFNYIEATTDKGRINLGRKEYSKGYDNDQKVLVDKAITKLFVSVPVKGAQLSIKNPSGVDVSQSPKVVKTVDLPDLKVVNILSPEPGDWSIISGGNEDYSLQVSGVSDVTFDYGFYRNSLSELTNRPISGEENHLVVEVKNAGEKIKKLLSVDISNVKGQTNLNFPLRKINDSGAPHLYSTDPHIFTEDYFYVNVNGVEENDAPFRRVSSTAIHPQAPSEVVIEQKFEMKPSIQVPDKENKAEVGNTVYLPCNASGIPKPKIIWTLPDGSRIDAESHGRRELDYKDSLVIHNLNINDGGKYICEAENVGKMEADTTLFVGKRPFFVEKPPTVIPVTKRNPITLTCHIDGIPKPTVSLYHWDDEITDLLQNGDKYSLEIQKSLFQDSGEYKCVGKNVFGQVEESMILRVKGFEIYN